MGKQIESEETERGLIGVGPTVDIAAEPIETPWMTLEEAAAYLRISSTNPATLRRLIREEGLPVVKIGERIIRTRATWIDEWLARLGTDQAAAG